MTDQNGEAQERWIHVAIGPDGSLGFSAQNAGVSHLWAAAKLLEFHGDALYMEILEARKQQAPQILVPTVVPRP